MEYSFSFSASFMVIILALVTLFNYIFTISRKASNKKRLPPEAAGGWPVIGHLPLLAGSQPRHITLGNLADQMGPIFTIKIGVHRVLVVNNSELARECLTTNDKAFANRPKALAMEILGYNYFMVGTSPYGEYWRQIRKIVSLGLLSNQRLGMLKHVREAEVKASIEGLYNEWIKNKNNSSQVLLELKRWFWDVSLNVIFKMVIGKRYAEPKKGDEGRDSDDEWRYAMRDFFKLTGKFVVSDAFPFLRCLDLGGDEKVMKKTAKELDNVLGEWLHEHKQTRASGMAKKRKEDFMDELLSIMDDAKEFSSQDVDTIIKSTCLALILAASDSTAVTLTWTLSLLLNNRHVLKKAQQELDIIVGRERQVNESDTKDLVYLQAIIKESFRLYPAGPLSVPHESIEDCSIGGYHIPAERFLTTHKDVDVKGQNFELIPFSSGRRMCPGVSFAVQVLNLTLATLLHSFEIETPSGQTVDMTEGAGQINIKVTPIDALLEPRLPPHLYCY
ncbi:flavonoid-6-hydroxylase-like isoform X2 [Hevea brasiliensis]|uniref:flavonoid-6-hydroxylase-like isoform X2 n=1 Tax=Hevea brasiliensis TaxID=3981 RepID=UPI0025CBF2BE|nr:flavonoid-6-hydroxylase-like isoform X2 [Hevea brasiliensis]